MTSPVFPIPLIPRRPDHWGLALPEPRGRSPTLVDDSALHDFGLDDTGTPLAVTVDDRGGVYVVRADGEVDLSTAPLLDGALAAGLASGCPTVVVDLRDISFVDCTGIGLLTQASCRARRQGTQLHILASRAIARTAAILDLTTTLGLHGTRVTETDRPA
jgi:anti-sigma B factor antagonist